MPHSKFTLKESDKMIRDVLDQYFEQKNQDFDLKELMATNLLGEGDNLPAGYHRMPETGEISPDYMMEEENKGGLLG